MFKVHIHTEVTDAQGKSPYIEDVVCPQEELASQLKLLGEAILQPNTEFGVGDNVSIVFHLVPEDSHE